MVKLVQSKLIHNWHWLKDQRFYLYRKKIKSETNYLYLKQENKTFQMELRHLFKMNQKELF